MKKILVLATLLCLLFPMHAKAHVVLQDSKAKMGAVLHITPDDDPIAGEPSSLAFDIQDQTVTNDTYSFILQISDSVGNSQVIPFLANRTVISASYLFPSQGLYTIELKADPLDTSKQPLVFTHTQQISRGIATTESPPRSHPAAEAGLVGSCIALLVLGIVFWNNRSGMQQVLNRE